MAIILGLLIFCLGLYFLSLFFQVARLEKLVTDSVVVLEQFMIVKYSLGTDKKKAQQNKESADAAAPPAIEIPKPASLGGAGPGAGH